MSKLYVVFLDLLSESLILLRVLVLNRAGTSAEQYITNQKQRQAIKKLMIDACLLCQYV
jgi:hypothetical protein